MIIRNVSWALNQHIRMISQGSCDVPKTYNITIFTEFWSNKCSFCEWQRLLSKTWKGFMSPNVWAVVYQPDHWYCASLCITHLKCLLMIIWGEEVVSACIGFHQSCLGASGSCHICLSLIHPLRQSLLKTGGTQWTKFKVNVFIPKRSVPLNPKHIPFSYEFLVNILFWLLLTKIQTSSYTIHLCSQVDFFLTRTFNSMLFSFILQA